MGETALFKLGMSLVFAFIAAMAIVLSGLLSDVRLLTVLLRSAVGFLITGALVWLVTMILEHQNIVGFDRNLELIDQEEQLEPKSIEAYEEEDAAAAQGTDGEAANPEVDGESEAGHSFMPLSQENLKHMEPPPDD